MNYPYASVGPALRWVVLVALLVFFLLALAVLVVLAALPGRIATRRAHPQAAAINLLGWLGLPTGVLWIVAVVWARMVQPSAATSDLSGIADQVTQLDQALARLERRLEGDRG